MLYVLSRAVHYLLRVARARRQEQTMPGGEQCTASPEPATSSAPVSQWSGLRTQMSITFIWVTLAFVAGILCVRLTIFFLLREPARDLVPSFFIVTTVPPITLTIGMLAGFVATRQLVGRIQRLVLATTHFAAGNYTQCVLV